MVIFTMPGSERLLQTADILVISASLFSSCAIGVYYGYKGRKGSTTEEYLMAGRNLRVLPVAASISVSFLSAITLLSDPVEVYYRGSNYWAMIVGTVLAVVASGYITVPVFHNAHVVSTYEYLEHRMGKTMRYVGAAFQIIYQVVYLGLVLYAPSVAISHVSGLDIRLTIAFVITISTFYTTMGGLRAVVWVDTLQSSVMFAGLLAVIIQAIITMGGVKATWHKIQISQRVDTWIFTWHNRGTFWEYFIGGFACTFCHFTIAQFIMQRFCALSTAKKAQRTALCAAPILFALISILGIEGIILAAYYVGCDPAVSGKIQRPEEMVTLMVSEIFEDLPGLTGLFLSCIITAALSTLSSGQNSLAVSVLKDVVQPVMVHAKRGELDDKTSTRFAKIISLLSGVLLAAVAFIMLFIEETVFTMFFMLIGLQQGPMASMFFIAYIAPHIGTACTLIGVSVGLAVTLWLSVGAILTKPKTYHLPFFSEECDFVGNYTTGETSTLYVVDNTLSTITNEQTDVTNFADGIYAISPMYFALIGCTISIAAAYLCYCIKRAVLTVTKKEENTLQGERRENKLEINLEEYKVIQETKQ